MAVDPIGTFTVARFPARRVPGLLATVPLERRRLARTAGIAFARHLGTARGESTTLAADLTRWATFALWDDADAAAGWHDRYMSRLHPAEACTLTLRPLRATGLWGGRELPVDGGDPPDGEALAVLTRASIRPSRLRRFYASVPDVDADLLTADGRLASLGFGEWPVATQGTFSLWRDEDAFRGFAYRGERHAEVVRRTRREEWYREDLFARFAVLGASGTWPGLGTVPGVDGG